MHRMSNINKGSESESDSESESESESESVSESVSELESESASGLESVSDKEITIHHSEIISLLKQFSNTIEENITNLNNRIRVLENVVESKINNLEIKILKLLKKDDETDTFIELKKEVIHMDKNDVIRNLKFNDHRSVVNLFKMYFYKKENNINKYPIKIKSKRSLEYYVNGSWHEDISGHYIMNTICWIFEQLFMSVNNIDNISNCQQMINNQNFIYKLNNLKTKKEILKFIIEEVKLSL